VSKDVLLCTSLKLIVNVCVRVCVQKRTDVVALASGVSQRHDGQRVLEQRDAAAQAARVVLGPHLGRLLDVHGGLCRHCTPTSWNKTVLRRKREKEKKKLFSFFF
jgi:hypothetical protein